jgi:hypothetical protein
MGWFDRSHVDSTFWSSSYLILVTGGLVAPIFHQVAHALSGASPRVYGWMHLCSKSQDIYR